MAVGGWRFARATVAVPMDFFSQANPIYARVYAGWANFAKNHKYNPHVVTGQSSFQHLHRGGVAGKVASRTMLLPPTR